MLKGIEFDLDGTLILFQIDYKRVRSETRRVLESYGYPSGQLTLDMLVIDMFQQANTYFIKEQGMTEKKFQEIKNEADRAVILIEAEAALCAKPMPGMEEILKFVDRKHLKYGILTYNTTANAILSLEKAGLLHYFPNHDLIVGRDRVLHPKPHPDHTLFLLNRLGLQASEVCIIGDHPRDCEAANNIHARSIAITSDVHPAKDFPTEYHCSIPEISKKIPTILEIFLKN
jgi:phosphoglycolate phosphatase